MAEFTPVAYDDDYGAREWERLEQDLYHRLESEETRYFLDREFPENGQLLDCGGSAGRYAVELAQQGNEVRLVDLSHRQVELAEQHAAGSSVPCGRTPVAPAPGGANGTDAHQPGERHLTAPRRV